MAEEKKLFAVIAVDRPAELEVLIVGQFPENHLKVDSGQWFVVGPSTLTTQELAVQLQISAEPSVTSAIVLNVNSYFGRASLNTWEWVAAKMGGTNAVAG